MTIENKLQLFLLKTEYDFCDFIKEENSTLYFECCNEFSDEIDLVSCVPFINDDNSKGYEIFFTREVQYSNHTSNHTAPITHVYVSEL